MCPLLRTLATVTLLHVFVFREVAAAISLVCKPGDFGAAGDGVHLDSDAISRAVEACRDGGIVQFEPGKTYRFGEITVTGRGVHVDLPPNATLLASAERAHYGAQQASWYLLHFYRCIGCALTGGGLIQGPAWAFVDNSTTPATILNWRDATCRVRRQCRPRLVGVVESSHVRVEGVSMRDSAFWTLHIRDSEHVTVRGVAVTGDMDFPNNDGIDIDGSSHVTVLQSYIATADDALCVKATSGGGRGVRHVHVSNCTLQSRSAAVKLGSETRADMANLTFSHLQVLDSNRGLAIQLRDHGAIRDVVFRHVRLATRRYPGRWWGGGEPIYVTALPRWLGARVGSVANVTFADIAADVAGAVVVVAGSPESLVRGVLLRDVRMALGPLQNQEPSPSLAPPPGGGGGGAAAAAAAAGAAAAAAAAAKTAAGGAGLEEEQTPHRAAVRRAARRAAARAGEDAAASASASMSAARVMASGGSAGGAAGGALQLRVKLDLRPGPYGERPWLATAPVLAQFTWGLELRNVSFQIREAGGDEGAAPAAFPGGGAAWVRERGGPWIESQARGRGRGGRGQSTGSLWWADGQLAARQEGGGGGDSGGGWYQELVQRTVQVAAAEQVDVRVVPAATSGPVRYALLGDGAAGRRRWARQLSGAVGGWRRASWLGAAAALAAIAAVLLPLLQRPVQGQLPLLHQGGASGSKRA